MRELIERKDYLEKLDQLRDKHVIKVVSGIRRCGKSSLFKLFQKRLLESGVEERQIQVVNFEDLNESAFINYRDLHERIVNNLVSDKMNYIFLDEVQLLENFEKVIDSLFIRDNIDLYITGSNAYFLSSEWATILSGRYIEISILPFSFKEYVDALGSEDHRSIDEKFEDFLKNGGFPQSVEMFKESYELGIDYLSGIYNTVLVKDILTRKEIDDSDVLNNVLRFVFDNISNVLSPNSVANYITSNYKSIKNEKIDSILRATEESFVLYPARRFDIRGKELLQTKQKYYLVDTGLRQVLLARDKQFDRGRALENVVYLELLRRGFQVWTGKTKNSKEVDFVVKAKDGTLKYFQVADTMLNEVTAERELSALRDIDDNHEKIILTSDFGSNDYNGIKQLNVIRWLMEQ